jgi:hypothetical protein
MLEASSKDTVKGIIMEQPRMRWFSHVQEHIKETGKGWQGTENKKLVIYEHNLPSNLCNPCKTKRWQKKKEK